MKKFLKIVAALIIVIIIAIVALLKWVDPNEYRGYMVAQVEANTGYKLEINGDLRWHIWPQISILVNDVKVTAPGAKKEIIKAENMRLDVDLIPLLSQQLSVKQVMVKGAVIKLTGETQAVVDESEIPANVETSAEGEASTSDVPANDAGSPDISKATDWSFELQQFEILDSLVILQQSDDLADLLTVRDINLTLNQKEPRVASLDAKAKINRDQQDFSLNIVALLDFKNFPQSALVTVSSLAYQFKEAGGKAEGLKGDVSLVLAYDQKSNKAVISDLIVKANGDIITGAAEAILNEQPDIMLTLNADHVNVDALLNALPKAQPAANSAKNSAQQDSVGNKTTKGSSKNNPAATNPLAALQGLNAKVKVNLKALVVSGLTVNDLVLNVDNKLGKVQINQFSGLVLGGSFSVPGSINAAGKAPYVQLNPKLNNINLNTLAKAFKLPQVLTGNLNVKDGTLSGAGIDAQSIQHGWKGSFNVEVNNGRLENINIQQVIEKALSVAGKSAVSQDKYANYTDLKVLKANVALNKGMVNLTKLAVDSTALALNGVGNVNLNKMSCDVNLNVKLLQALKGKKEAMEVLRNAEIPVHLYGPCNNLAYKVNVEKLLKEQAKSQVKVQAEKALDKHLGGEKNQKKREFVGKYLGGLLK